MHTLKAVKPGKWRGGAEGKRVAWLEPYECRPSMPVCEIPGCGKSAAVVMRAPAEVPGKEHQLCPAHAWWIALRLGRVGVTYTSRPLAAA